MELSSFSSAFRHIPAEDRRRYLYVLIAYLAQLLIRAGYSRRICAVRYGLDNLTHIGYFIGVFNNDLAGCLLAEIGKLVEHLLRRSEIERSLLRGIGKALTGHDNLSENAVALVHKMNVAGGNGELSEPVGSGDYLLIYVLKLACILTLPSLIRNALLPLGCISR